MFTTRILKALCTYGGIEYLGTNTHHYGRNGTTKYKYKDIEITHFQDIDPQYEIIDVTLKGEDERTLSVIERLINLSVRKKYLNTRLG